MSTSIPEQSALDSSFISEQPRVVSGVHVQLPAVIADTFEQPTMVVDHVPSLSNLE